MAQSIIFPEWLNANALRNYPIRENASRVDISGNFKIPNDLIVSAQVNLSRDYVNGAFFISKLLVTENKIKIFVSYDPVQESAVAREIGSINIEASEFSQFSYYSFSGQGEDSAVIGSLAIGDIKSTINAGVGEFSFNRQSTILETNVLFVSIPALKTVEIYNGDDELLHRATEILKIKEGENIKLTYVSNPTDPYGTIRIDAINGQNLLQASDCENVTELLPPCIKRINGVGPNLDGVIYLVGSDCIDVLDQPERNTLELSDTCSESCCGCIELQALTDALEQLKAQEEAIKNLVNSTQSQQSELLANIISNL